MFICSCDLLCPCCSTVATGVYLFPFFRAGWFFCYFSFVKDMFFFCDIQPDTSWCRTDCSGILSRLAFYSNKVFTYRKVFEIYRQISILICCAEILPGIDPASSKLICRCIIQLIFTCQLFLLRHVLFSSSGAINFYGN